LSIDKSFSFAQRSRRQISRFPRRRAVERASHVPVRVQDYGDHTLAVPSFLQSIEQTSLSTWLRDSPSFFGYWFIITFHAIGMGLLVGASAVIDLRVLGVARELPMAPLKRLYSIIWVAFWIQVISGTLLLISYPTKALTNIDFYLKLALIAAGMVVMLKLKVVAFEQSGTEGGATARRLAMWSLVLWAGAITAGRFLAYTYTYLTYPTDQASSLLNYLLSVKGIV